MKTQQKPKTTQRMERDHMATKTSEQTATKEFLVRLKPRNPKTGHTLASFTVYGLRFMASRGWYKVTPVILTFDRRDSPEPVTVDLIKYLSGVRQVNDNPESPLAFDICNEAQARAIDRAEKRAKEKRDEIPEVRVLRPE